MPLVEQSREAKLEAESIRQKFANLNSESNVACEFWASLASSTRIDLSMARFATATKFLPESRGYNHRFPIDEDELQSYKWRRDATSRWIINWSSDSTDCLAQMEAMDMTFLIARSYPPRLDSVRSIDSKLTCNTLQHISASIGEAYLLRPNDSVFSIIESNYFDERGQCPDVVLQKLSSSTFNLLLELEWQFAADNDIEHDAIRQTNFDFVNDGDAFVPVVKGVKTGDAR